MTTPTAPIFIGGAGRSGTTLLRVILDSHPNICCGPELKVTPHLAKTWEVFQKCNLALEPYEISQSDITQLFRKLLQDLVARKLKKEGKRRIAEKTPGNIQCIQQLHYIFPESPLIHVIRDGRDVVCSLMTMDWINPLTGEPMEMVSDIRKASEYWVEQMKWGAATLKNTAARKKYIELRYENLVSSPEPLLRRLFEILEEPWSPKLLEFYKQERDLAGESSAEQVRQPIYKKAVSRWEKDLTGKDKDIVKEVAGEMLIKTGYAKDRNW